MNRTRKFVFFATQWTAPSSDIEDIIMGYQKRVLQNWVGVAKAILSGVEWGHLGCVHLRCKGTWSTWRRSHCLRGPHRAEVLTGRERSSPLPASDSPAAVVPSYLRLLEDWAALCMYVCMLSTPIKRGSHQAIKAPVVAQPVAKMWTNWRRASPRPRACMLISFCRFVCASSLSASDFFFRCTCVSASARQSRAQCCAVVFQNSSLWSLGVLGSFGRKKSFRLAASPV